MGVLDIYSINHARILHDDVIKLKHFPRCCPFVRGIHRSPVNSPHKGQWRGAVMFSLICVWINSWVNNRQAGDLRCYRAHYDVTVMKTQTKCVWNAVWSYTQFRVFWLKAGNLFHSCLEIPATVTLNDKTSYRKISSGCREIRVETFPITLKFKRHIGSSAAEMPVKFQSITIIRIFNIAASRLHESWW